ncbi:unannotated protein [freshwater metagenome]|uniref:Unannotated protein n=1 Tax=freshwater metagenome TaxID=449393 RepID=A0A6J6LE48_9ZZZZ
MSAASLSESRWLVPPPATTAAFSRSRSPGVVFRVSRITVLLPATAATHWSVSVAIPPRCPKKFSAVRSASKIARVSPRTVIKTDPGTTRSPSRRCCVISVRPTSRKVAIAISIPAITPPFRAVKSAITCSSPETVATDVMSFPPARSSASALRIKSISTITSPPENRYATVHRYQGSEQFACATLG